MKKLVLTMLAVSGLISMNSMADAATGNLLIKARVVKSCFVNTNATGAVTAAVIDFGDITSLANNVDADTSGSGGAKVGVLCSNGTSWTLTAGAGNNEASTQRRMITGSGTTVDYLPYNLYSNSARSTQIAVGGNVAVGTGTGNQQTYDVYARIPAGTPLPTAGNYIDTVALTITY
ncbi:Csu type fimbrial protein [Acinetobacter sp. GXMZU3951]|jgi:spore coat protein U-like protein